MASAVTVEKLLARNSEYSETHRRIPTWEELGAAGAPAPQTLIITCSDPRCIPENYFKLNIGEALIVRNGAGNAPAALATIIAVDTLVSFNDILVVKHTDCGGLQIRDANVKAGLHQLAPAASDKIEAMAFGEITGTLQDAVKEDVAWLKASEFLRPELRERVYGYVYDLETGKVNQVV